MKTKNKVFNYEQSGNKETWTYVGKHLFYKLSCRGHKKGMTLEIEKDGTMVVLDGRDIIALSRVMS